MSCEVDWMNIPENVRENIYKAVIPGDLGVIERINNELIKYKGFYSDKGTIVFPSKAHLNWFIVRWS